MMNLQENARELAAKPGNFKDWWFEDMGKSNGKAMEAKRGRTVEQRVMDRGKLKNNRNINGIGKQAGRLSECTVHCLMGLDKS